MKIEIEREADRRWIAEVTELPGVMVYGKTRKEAVSKVEALAHASSPTVWITGKRSRNWMSCSRCRMSAWRSAKARQVLAALLRIGWTIKREARGSHRVLSRPGWPDCVFAFHDSEEIGPRMLSRISKRTGLTPKDCSDDGRYGENSVAFSIIPSQTSPPPAWRGCAGGTGWRARRL